MLRTFLGISLILAAATPAIAAEPLLTKERTATLQRLWKEKHPWAQFAQGIATGSFGENPYGGAHQWQTLLWKMTGDDKYARAAVASLLPAVREAKETVNRNATREASFYFALEYQWLKKHMTPAERADYEAALRQWAVSMLGRGNPGIFTLPEDSDEVIGHYFGLRLIDQALGSDYSTQPAKTGIDAPKMRERIKDFCKLAAGGEWIESSEYNLGTLQLLLLGSAAVGMDEFPEVKALLPQFAEQLRWHLTPDLKDSVQWGDEQEPHNLHLNNRVALMAIICGLGGDESGELAKLLGALTKDRPVYPHFWHNLYRALWMFDPSTLPEAPPTMPEGLRVALGQGLAIYRRQSALLQVHMQPQPQPLYVDHTVDYFGDVRLWLNGEWVIDHPLGYGPHASAHNCGLLAGLGHMHERGIVSAKETAVGCKIVGRTKGPRHVNPKYYNPPPAFADWTREIEYDGTLRVADKFSGRAPGANDNYYPQEKANLKASLGLWTQLWHAPGEPTETANGYTWHTKGGQKVTLKTTAARRIKRKDELGVTLHGNFHEDQLQGWQIVLLSDEPKAVIETTIEVSK